MQERFDQHRELMKFHDRGRPRTASEEVRLRGYRDENRQYAFSNGLKPWHERIVDWLICNPHAKVVDVAREFHVTPQWAGMVMRSDAFREYYSARMQEHQGLVAQQIVAKMQGVATKALDRIADKLDVADIEESRQAAEMTLKALGYTSNVRVSVDNRQQTQNVYSLPKEVYETARQRMLEAQKNKELPEHDEGAYRHVTSALERQREEVEDAVVVSDKDE